jgi:hypothetical protein
VQQRLVSPERLADCFHPTPTPSDATNFVVKEIYDEPWVVPGDGKKRRPAKAVTMAVVVDAALENGESAMSETERFTQHVFRVGDRWAWIIPSDTLASCR